MSAVRPEPVQVQVIDDRPVRFVWRERLYTVLSIIERPREGSEPERHDRPAEWRCWRITASPGKNVPAVPFRLCQDQSVDRWELTRD